MFFVVLQLSEKSEMLVISAGDSYCSTNAEIALSKALQAQPLVKLLIGQQYNFVWIQQQLSPTFAFKLIPWNFRRAACTDEKC